MLHQPSKREISITTQTKDPFNLYQMKNRLLDKYDCRHKNNLDSVIHI